MNMTGGIAIIGIVVTVLLNAAGYLVAWGVLQGTVRALSDRVKVVEGELAALKSLELQVTKIETKLEGLLEQFKDLNASIRWMREPAPYEGQPQPGVTRPKGPRR